MKKPDADSPELYLTTHAMERTVERKLNLSAVDVVLRHGDLERRGRDGCVRLRLSRREGKRLDRVRSYPRTTIDHARETELVVSPDRKSIITGWKLPVDERFRRSGPNPGIQRAWPQAED